MPGPHEFGLIERSVALCSNNARQLGPAATDVILPIAAQKSACVRCAWLLHYEPIDGVIVGAATLDQVRANAHATAITPSPDEFDRIDHRFAALTLDRMEGYAKKPLAQKPSRFKSRANRALDR